MSELVAKLNNLNFDLNSINYLVLFKEKLINSGIKENVDLILNDSYNNQDKKEMHFLTYNNKERNEVLKIARKIDGYTPYVYISAKLGDLTLCCRINS
jgi:hypothetical protein